ncbi:MAG: TetR/AcrR family transcriptional regulator [Bacteroidota bacterium]|jgi:AcrR family transcriptional regulator|nr:TetR/AcrR family transcriptional regulator [Bacteroidota bacterium]MCA4898497.1 TetR/AcrR family transcriptional regulator [Cytophagales bacterium]MCE2958105.1 TetR/AcrR family transcriptional regulator [Flammeovirgaceae bacterium]MCZ8068968.1 TetR/AcrR family transcriptional regulator [Cytophagales bacterium]
MGVKERKERDRQEMRDQILKSAHQLFLEKGFDQISIRNIAEAIEYSPATIYLYFKDKNEIVHALHQDGFKLLNQHFQPLAKFEQPFERLKEMGKAYIKFATENPGVYELMFMRSEPMEHVSDCLDEEWREGDRAFEFLVETVAQCQSQGYFKGLHPHSFSMMIWSFIHGLCSLRISQHLGHVKGARESKISLDDIMTTTYATFSQALEKLKG